MHRDTPTSSFMIPPTMRAPVLTAKSGRWASEVMTSEMAHNPMFPSMSGSTAFGVTPTPAGGWDAVGTPPPPAAAAGGMGGPAYSGGGMFVVDSSDRDKPVEYPPPPPPPEMPGEDAARHQMRMMKWFQDVEQWECMNRGDRDRMLVAPPPRPPPFTAFDRTTVPLAGTGLLVRGMKAPYDFVGWVAACRRWWPHVARHYQRLTQRVGAAPSAPISLVTSPQPVLPQGDDAVGGSLSAQNPGGFPSDAQLTPSVQAAAPAPMPPPLAPGGPSPADAQRPQQQFTTSGAGGPSSRSSLPGGHHHHHHHQPPQAMMGGAPPPSRDAAVSSSSRRSPVAFTAGSPSAAAARAMADLVAELCVGFDDKAQQQQDGPLTAGGGGALPGDGHHHSHHHPRASAVVTPPPPVVPVLGGGADVSRRVPSGMGHR